MIEKGSEKKGEKTGQLPGEKFYDRFSKPRERETDFTSRSVIQKTAFFNSKAKTVIVADEDQIDEELSSSQQEILTKIGVWISEGSGWTIRSVDSHYINVVKYQPLRGSSYIPLPQALQNPKKGLINLQNKDNECFRWYQIRYLNPQEKDPQRSKLCDREFVKKLDSGGIEFPVEIKDIPKIEKQNNIRISVFGYDAAKTFPLYVSPLRQKDQELKVVKMSIITFS